MVDGTIGGQAVSIVDSLGAYGVGTSLGSYAGTQITSIQNSCPLFQSAATSNPGHDPPNSSVLTLLVMSGGGAVPPGTYPLNTVQNSFTAQANIELTDATCQDLPTSASASRGSITIDTADASLVTGTFDVTFPSGDHLSGSFHAPVCAYDLKALQQNGLGSCG